MPRHLGITESPNNLCSALAGIVSFNRGKMQARHPVYSRILFESVVDQNDIARAIKATIRAFSVYGSPVVVKVDKNEGKIFKSILNHRFLKDILHDDEGLILDIYKSFETYFHNDGLYWVQYGLALRSFGRHEDAYDKLRTASEAYSSNHTEHALAQQLLILADRAPDRTVAMAYLADAVDRLKAIDSVIEAEDMYPIVTLSEGHTKIIRRWDGEKAGRTIAHDYANSLGQRVKEGLNEQRLKSAWQRLMKYATTGSWSEPDIF